MSDSKNAAFAAEYELDAARLSPGLLAEILVDMANALEDAGITDPVLVINQVGNLSIIDGNPRTGRFLGWVDVRTGEAKLWSDETETYLTIAHSQPRRTAG